MGRQGLCLEVLRQPVILTGEACAGIEITLCYENRLTQGSYIIRSGILAGKPADNIHKGLEGLRLV